MQRSPKAGIYSAYLAGADFLQIPTIPLQLLDVGHTLPPRRQLGARKGGVTWYFSGAAISDTSAGMTTHRKNPV